MAKFEVQGPDGKKYQVNAPKGSTQDDAIAYVKENFYKKSLVDEALSSIKDNYLGLAAGGADIARTLLPNFIGVSRDEIPKVASALGADTEGIGFKGSRLGAQIVGTSPVGGILGAGAKAAGMAKLGNAIQSGGLSLGGTGGNAAANIALRGAGGAIQGGAQTALVDPSQAGLGAAIGAAVPGAAWVGGKLGNAVNSGLNSLAEKSVKSALKPSTTANIDDVKTAIQTILNNKVNVSLGGAEKLNGMISGLSKEIDSMVNSSTGTVAKADVIKALDRSIQKFSMQANPVGDLKAIKAVRDEFAQVWPDQIPTQVAHQLKKGTYAAINSKNYGELSGASTEAQKDLGRGLKEGVENNVDGIKEKNKALSDYLTTLEFLNRAAGRESNKDFLGLSILSGSPEANATMLLDRNALFKSMLGRGFHNTANGINAISNPNLPYGLLGAPSLLSISP